MIFTATREASSLIPHPVICYFEHLEVKPPQECQVYDPMIASLMERLDVIRSELWDTPEVQGFRELYPAKPAGERLWESVKKKGVFPRYGSIVDAINIVSLGTLTPLGTHDARMVREETELRLKLSAGTETLIPSFQKKVRTIPKGEITYGFQSDKAYLPLAWLGTQDVDNRDFQLSETTTSAIVTVIGHGKTSLEHNHNIAGRILELLQMTSPGVTMQLYTPKIAST